jgi:hypothetical protein
MVRSDYQSKLAVLNYDLDADARLRYVALLNTVQALASSARIWSVSSKYRSADTKYSAGAATLEDKKSVSVRLTPPKWVETTIAVWEMALSEVFLS